jgi:hypothetical protein
MFWLSTEAKIYGGKWGISKWLSSVTSISPCKGRRNQWLRDAEGFARFQETLPRGLCIRRPNGSQDHLPSHFYRDLPAQDMAQIHCFQGKKSSLECWTEYSKNLLTQQLCHLTMRNVPFLGMPEEAGMLTRHGALPVLLHAADWAELWSGPNLPFISSISSPNDTLHPHVAPAGCSKFVLGGGIGWKFVNWWPIHRCLISRVF